MLAAILKEESHLTRKFQNLFCLPNLTKVNYHVIFCFYAKKTLFNGTLESKS